MSQENAGSKQPLIRYVNRQQMSWRAVEVEKLIGEDHPARGIGARVGRLDLRRFYEDIARSGSAVVDQLVGVRLQPRDGLGPRSGAALRVRSGVPVADGAAGSELSH